MPRGKSVGQRKACQDPCTGLDFRMWDVHYS